MKVLVIGPAWVGDMVMAQVLFRCLRQQHPDAIIDVLAPAWCRDLLTRMPEVRHALPLPIGHGELALGKRWHIGRELAKDAYDQAIVLPNSFKSALIPRFAGIARRTGWRGEARGWLLNDCRQLDKQQLPLMVQRFAALAYAATSPPSWLQDTAFWSSQAAAALRPQLQTSPAAITALRERLHLGSDKPVLVLCPGAEFGPAKQWPAAHYAAVARHFAGAGMQVWLMGSAKDAEVAHNILAQAGTDGIISLCGRTTLGDAVDLMAVASAVVSNDSGLMHVAAALARPLVVVYGSTSPAFTPPLAGRVQVLSLALACSPCFKRECPLGHLDCLRQLAPSRVIAAVQGLLAAAD